MLFSSRTHILFRGAPTAHTIVLIPLRLGLIPLSDRHPDVRFDVFSPVHSTLKHRFRERSCLLMRERRRRGAFCLVAALGESARAAAAAAVAADRGAANGEGERGQFDGEGGGDVDVDVDVVNTVGVSHDHVLGTLECSRHEFDGTPLEVQVEEGGAKIARWGWDASAVRLPLRYCCTVTPRTLQLRAASCIPSTIHQSVCTQPDVAYNFRCVE